MYTARFSDFLAGKDNIQIYERGELLYSSDKDSLIPWLEYINLFFPYVSRTLVFSRITGNAAALLAVKAGCHEIYSPLGSRLAVLTLERYQIKHHFIQTVPYIRRSDGAGRCPLEKFSAGKSPEEFYESVRPQLMLEIRSN